MILFRHACIFLIFIGASAAAATVNVVDQTDEQQQFGKINDRPRRRLKRSHPYSFKLANHFSDFNITDFIAELDMNDDDDANNGHTNRTDQNIKKRDLANKKDLLDVVIIGAGWAGISAANRLKNKGVKNFQVLEARDYIGGRSHTQDVSGIIEDKSVLYPFDMGSFWLHGTTGNPITKLAKKLDVQWVEDKDKTVIYKGNAKGKFNKRETNHFLELYQDFYEFQGKQQDKESTTKNTNLHSAAEEFKEKKKLDNEDKVLLNAATSNQIVQSASGSLRDLSLLWWNSDEAYGAPEGILNKGYGHFIQAYAKPVKDKVELNCVVKKIQRNKKFVVIHTQKGEKIKAKRAIVTVPLGVLKAGSIEFKPKLPAANRNAITQLGMGLLNKVLLVFKEEDIFWPKNKQWILPSSTVSESNPGQNDKREAKVRFEFFSPYAMTGDPYIVGFLAGDDAWMMENYDRNTGSDYDYYNYELDGDRYKSLMKTGAMDSLKNMFGDDIPEPALVKTTAWGDDQFSYGAYSYNKVGMDETARKKLKKDVKGRLFFAGEATSNEYPGTTHGALLSGKSAADKVLDFM